MNTRFQIALQTSTEVEEWALCGKPVGTEVPWPEDLFLKGSSPLYFRHNLTHEVVATLEYQGTTLIEQVVPPGYGVVEEEEVVPEEVEKTTWKIAKTLRHELLADDNKISRLVKLSIALGIVFIILIIMVSTTDFGVLEETQVGMKKSVAILTYLTLVTCLYMCKRLVDSRVSRKRERRQRTYERVATIILRERKIPDRIGKEPINPDTLKKIQKILEEQDREDLRRKEKSQATNTGEINPPQSGDT